MDYTDEQINEWKHKAEQWDALDKEIGSYYSDEEDDDSDDAFDGSLLNIGEAAASAFGYL